VPDLNQENCLGIDISDKKVILEPKILIPKEQACFYSEDWQAGKF
jgi:hypothetical protein